MRAGSPRRERRSPCSGSRIILTHKGSSGQRPISTRRSCTRFQGPRRACSETPSGALSTLGARSEWPCARPSSPRFGPWARTAGRSHVTCTRSVVMNEALLDVQDLRVYFPVFQGFVQRILGGGDVKVHAVDGVSFSIAEGEVFGLVGESGCGKSTIAKTLVGLVRATSGRIRFREEDITHPGPKALFHVRERIQLIYQDAHAALSPAMTVGEAIADVLRTHGLATESGERVPPKSEDELRQAVYRIFDDVGLRPPVFYYDKYPDELSGGQKQRVVAGRVLALRPELIVADAPVAMLDMSVRARMLEFLLELKAKYSLTYLFITHDLATAKFLCDRIAIMYLGRIVETGLASEIYKDPKHPYTRALLQAIPVPDPRRRSPKILPKGEVPDAIFPPMGCRFHPRCPAVLPTCGWEGRDFVDYLEERRTDLEKGKVDEANLGPLDLWKAKGLVAERQCRPENIAIITEYVRSILNEAPSPLSKAVERVRNVETRLVVQFRTPDRLAPREIEGRLVACLLS